MALALDQKTIAARVEGRERWLREASALLDEHRQSRPGRCRAVAAAGCWRASAGCRRTLVERRPTPPMSATGRAGEKDGRRFGGPTEAV